MIIFRKLRKVNKKLKTKKEIVKISLFFYSQWRCADSNCGLARQTIFGLHAYLIILNQQISDSYLLLLSATAGSSVLLKSNFNMTFDTLYWRCQPLQELLLLGICSSTPCRTLSETKLLLWRLRVIPQSPYFYKCRHLSLPSQFKVIDDIRPHAQIPFKRQSIPFTPIISKNSCKYINIYYYFKIFYLF